jgi:membrane-bound lytic murein transglycosylase B
MPMKLALSIVSSLIFITACTGKHPTPTGPNSGIVSVYGQARPFSLTYSKLQGWDYLANQLENRGLAQDEIKTVFLDPRMPPFSVIPFSLKPQEPASMYYHFHNTKNIAAARTFLRKYQHPLQQAEKQYGVNRKIITAILLIETNLGQHFGRSRVIERLVRVASVAEPYNMELNFQRLKAQDPGISKEAIVTRAKHLEAVFVPEVVALFEIAKRRKVDIFEIRGSTAGAFGLPQFLPSSYLRFAVDGNRNGVISLFEPVDALFSTANYLEQHGWKERLTLSAKRAVILKYNNSLAYADAVLKVADTL